MWKSLLIVVLIFPVKITAAADIPGQQPNIAIDTKGVVRMVFGEGEKIYCMTSSNNGITFSSPVLVGQITRMHLGHTRGPQIASSKNYSMITAIDKDGTVHSFRANNVDGKWTKSSSVNNGERTALEGLMALAADKDDNFYATWLDIRTGNNNIFFSSINSKSSAWSKNLMVYKSPDQHVCECCKPNIAFNNNKLVIGFRNWLMGSRDIYYAVSTDKGKTFSNPKKSGTGTWALNACPMDGGGLTVNEKGAIDAAWRRDGSVYYSPENNKEQKIGSGRDVSMAQNNGAVVVAWQDKNVIKVMNLTKNSSTDIGKGISPRVYLLKTGKVICVWEDDKVVRYKLI